MRENAKLLWLVVGTGVFAAGCHDAEVHYEQAVIDEQVDSITVDVGSGDIVLRGSAEPGVTIDARIEGPSNHLGQALDNGHLTLFDDCHDEYCSVDVNALVPEDIPVALRTGSGDILLERTRGALLLRTGSGDIIGSPVIGVDLDAETGSGDVSLDIPGEIGRVHVNTGSGDVDLDVSSGTYRVNVSTGSGDRELSGIGSASDAPGLIEVRTGSGDVVIRGR